MNAHKGRSATTGKAQYGMRLRRMAACTYSGGGGGGGATTAGGAGGGGTAGVEAPAGSTAAEAAGAAAALVEDSVAGASPAPSSDDSPNAGAALSRALEQVLGDLGHCTLRGPGGGNVFGDESAVTLGGSRVRSGTEHEAVVLRAPRAC